MKIKFEENSVNVKIIEVEKTDMSSVYRAIAKEIVNYPPGSFVSVTCDLGTVTYKVTLRSGTILINEENNHLRFNDVPVYPHVKLTCVETGYNEVTGRDKNHYKFYELEQKGNDVIATYGRIGVAAGEKYGERTCIYPLSMFWIKYEEKIAKGYKDKTEELLTEEAPVVSSDEKPSAKRSTIASRLYEQLKSFCTKHIERSCKSTKITVGMINGSKKLLNELYNTTSVEKFNEVLLELLAISPRRVSQVCELLAKDESDFEDIIIREENLVNAMEGVKTVAVEADDQPFADIKVRKTSKADQDLIYDMVASSLKGKVTGTWKIESPKYENRFKEYLKEHRISKTKMLWHGSGNENWLSIINNGLLLNPNAVITGKMFGNGIYFAPSCMKSYGYTSDGKWRGYRCPYDSVFMGIYETAYGEPLKAQRSYHYTQADLMRMGKNCVHAEKGAYLRDDEIIYYSESAMVLKYLVRFSV